MYNPKKSRKKSFHFSPPRESMWRPPRENLWKPHSSFGSSFRVQRERNRNPFYPDKYPTKEEIMLGPDKDRYPTAEEILHDPNEDDLLKEFTQKTIEITQRLKDSGADEKTYWKEMKKIKDEFYRELIKKYPKEKSKIQRLRKNLNDFTKIKLRFVELLDIYKKRELTSKETRELENLNRKLKHIKF